MSNFLEAYQLIEISTRKHVSKYAYLLKRVRRIHFIAVVIEEPFRAILLQSPGREPRVNYCNTFVEPQRGGTSKT